MILTNFMKNVKFMNMLFSDHFAQMTTIAKFLLMFLRGHFGTLFCCVAFVRCFTIHLRQELPCIFNDFDVFADQKKVVCFRSEPLCVVLNAFLTCQN